jgi:hypothetical protein
MPRRQSEKGTGILFCVQRSFNVDIPIPIFLGTSENTLITRHFAGCKITYLVESCRARMTIAPKMIYQNSFSFTINGIHTVPVLGSKGSIIQIRRHVSVPPPEGSPVGGRWRVRLGRCRRRRRS